MSLNKILNRPMFRDVALKKGHIKPITAANGSFIGPVRPPVPVVVNAPGMGTMVGPGRTAPQVPAIRKQPTFFGRMGTGIVNLGRNIFSIPAIGGYYAGDKIGQALGIESELARMPLGIAGGVVASKALPVLAGLPATLSAGLLAGPAYLTIAGAKERERIKKMSPKERAAHTAKVREFGLEGYLDDDQFKKQFEIDPSKLDNIVKKSTKQTTPVVGAGRQTLRKDQKESIDFATTPGNITILGKDRVIDTSKIAENVIPNVDSGREGDSASAIARQSALPPSDDAQDKITDDDQTKDPPKDSPKGDADRATIDATSPMADRLKEARAIVKELRAGRGSQANLVFLSNLASALLTGTTRRKGIGGALEVFGAALGPAVNNLAMVRMKEDEIEQNLLGRVLEFQTDFLKAQNQGYEMPDTESVGVIQFTNSAGRLVNVPGRILKDGTKQRATGRVLSNGAYEYVSVSPDVNFIANKDMNKETLEIAKGLAGKYAALNLINRSLGIIERGEAQAGVTGAIGLYGGRLTEALGDVLSFTKIGGDSVSEVKAAGKAAFAIEQKKVANALVQSGEYDNVDDALKYLNSRGGLGTFQSNYNNAINNARKRLKGGNKLDYERLAINETVLVYKLANSLKSKDRLTQKDIEMAKGLVKVFPLFRGELNVIASLTATAETILDDIKQQERIYEKAGGSSEYLLNERKAYGLLPEGMNIDTMTDFESKKFKNLKDKINELTEEDFLKIFPPELFG